jgi:VWFA-related protein
MTRILLFCLAIVASAQEEPLVRVNTRLVEVDVVVRGKHGPVADLKSGDFTVFDQGKPQRIATFSVTGAQGRATSPELLPLGAVSNRLDEEGEETTGATVVLFDRLNTAPEDQAYGAVAFLRFLRGQPASDRIAIYSVSKTVSVIQEFTTDRERLIAAVSHASPEQSPDEGAADLVSDLPVTGNALADAMIRNAAAEMTDNAMRNRADITAYALETIAKHLSGLPGRKKLVWITAAFPAIYTYTGQRNLSTQIETREFSGRIDEAAHVLNDANVAVYPIDPRPPTSPNGGFLAPGIDTMNLFAGKTGGVAAYALTDLTGAIQSAMQDSEITYSLGFYPSAEKLDGGYHSLKVKVARSGVELRHRQGYLASEAKPPTEKQRETSLKDTFANPLEATGLGLTALAQHDPAKPGQYLLALRFNLHEFHLERENNRWVALLAIATQFPPKKRPNGTVENIKLTLTEERLKEALRDGYVLRRPYAAGDLMGDLRVVVQDRTTGLEGSVRVPIGKN